MNDHPKNVLIEQCKQLNLGKPQFNTRRTGPQHEPTFRSTALIKGEAYGKGEGGTKREAERQASEHTLKMLQNSNNNKNRNSRNNRSNQRTTRNENNRNSDSKNDNRRNSTRSYTNNSRNGSVSKKNQPNHQAQVSSHPSTLATNNIPSETHNELENFEGPWPMFPELLGTCLQIAQARVQTSLAGANAIREIHSLAVSLYKESLESLGEVVELDEDEMPANTTE